jgi:RimJ/RimL family protein N-acetyltransferase
MSQKQLRSGFLLTIRSPYRQDAAMMLEYLKIVGGETDNLTFGKEGHPFSVEEEETFLDSLATSSTTIMLIGLIHDQIVSSVSLGGTSRPRLRHSMELGISVRKDYWNQGIATLMIQEVIQKAKNLEFVEQITLKVSSTNSSAISLYQTLGFQITGTFPRQMKIHGEYIDTYLMILPLK